MSEEQQKRISVKEAVQIAGSVIRDLYEDVSISDLLLEEVRRGDDTWIITMSFSQPRGTTGGLGQILPPGRAFKQVRIDAETGEFMDMQIRTLPSPPPEQTSASSPERP